MNTKRFHLALLSCFLGLTVSGFAGVKTEIGNPHSFNQPSSNDLNTRQVTSDGNPNSSAQPLSPSTLNASDLKAIQIYTEKGSQAGQEIINTVAEGMGLPADVRSKLRLVDTPQGDLNLQGVVQGFVPIEEDPKSINITKAALSNTQGKIMLIRVLGEVKPEYQAKLNDIQQKNPQADTQLLKRLLLAAGIPVLSIILLPAVRSPKGLIDNLKDVIGHEVFHYKRLEAFKKKYPGLIESMESNPILLDLLKSNEELPAYDQMHGDEAAQIQYYTTLKENALRRLQQANDPQLTETYKQYYQASQSIIV